MILAIILLGSLGTLRFERAQKNAGLIRPEDRGRAFDVNRVGFHGLVIPEKRDRRPRLLLGGDRFLKTRQHILRQAHLRQRKQEATVDSAPWFRLTRSTCNPSRQPPVLGEQSSNPRSFQPMNQSNAALRLSYHQRSDVAR